jgi:hypothetical protein
VGPNARQVEFGAGRQHDAYNPTQVPAFARSARFGGSTALTTTGLQTWLIAPAAARGMF